MEVGFIGLGTMGASMAANLQKAGHRLIVINHQPAESFARGHISCLGQLFKRLQGRSGQGFILGMSHGFFQQPHGLCRTSIGLRAIRQIESG